MANEQIKQDIILNIKENNNNEITGEILQSVLLAMVDVLGVGAQFMGEAVQTTVPAAGDSNMFYLAVHAGTYTSFGVTTEHPSLLTNQGGTWRALPLTNLPIWNGAEAGSIIVGSRTNRATDEQAYAEGYDTSATAPQAHAEGNGTNATGDVSHAEGYGTNATGDVSHAEGSGTEAQGSAAHSEGDATTASGDYSHAEGNETTASGQAAHAEGEGAQALKKGAHAEGQSTTANGGGAHAEGVGSEATAKGAHAEGTDTEARAEDAHAEGYATVATGNVSHAEGSNSAANGAVSHAEGYDAAADGDYSHAEGNGTRTTNEAEHAEGKFNKSNSGTRHSVGIGTSNNDRKNAVEIMDNGDVYVEGVGGYDGTNAGASGVQTLQDEMSHSYGFIFDVTKENSGATFASLSALLSSPNLSTLIPTAIRTGGMTIRFVQTSDNKYVQYLYLGTSTDTADFTIESNWDRVSLENETKQILNLDYQLIKSFEADLEVCRENRRWEDSNGKVVLNEDFRVSVNSYKPILVAPYIPFSLTTNLDNTTTNVRWFITDKDDNILDSGTSTGVIQTISSTFPETAVKLYINSTSNVSGAPKLILGTSVVTRLNQLEEEKINRLTYYVRDDESIHSASVGDTAYLVTPKKFIKITGTSPLTYDELTYNVNSMFLYNNYLYYWNGSDLVLTINEQIVYLKRFATRAYSGLQKGDYFYLTNTKKIARNEGYTIYNNILTDPQAGVVYVYNNDLYYWNGTDLVKYTDEVVSQMTSYTDTSIKNLKESYCAREIVDNTTPLSLSESDFESGNLASGTGLPIDADNCIRSKQMISVVPAATLSISSTNQYRVAVFQYDSAGYVTESGWKTGDSSIELSNRATQIKIVIASPSGTSYAPVWSNIGLVVTPSKVKEYVRSISEKDVERYFDIELPILSPSPQLPANNSSESDCNAETVDSSGIHSMIGGLIDTLIAPNSSNYSTPKLLNRYDEVGMDASNTYPIYTYTFGLRNRYAWRSANELYAWKAGSTVVYIDSCSPRVGDIIYVNGDRLDSNKTVVSYSSELGEMVDSDNTTYQRDSESDIDALMFYTKTLPKLSNPESSLPIYYKGSVSSQGSATYVDNTHLSYNGKSYARAESFDYHTDQLYTLFIWGNEHGPTSDPMEPSIILYRLLKDLCVGCSNNPFLTYLKKYCKFVMIPCANPWGCQYPRVNGRVNSNGVNINRNYDTPGWSIPSDADKGSYAGDQNETQYIMNMCKRFKADLAIDIHCLGFGNPVSQGIMQVMGDITENGFENVKNTMTWYGYQISHETSSRPNQSANGYDWITNNNIVGGLIEMNAGGYSADHVFDGKQHTKVVMESDYTELLNSIRLWLSQLDSELNLSRLFIK